MRANIRFISLYIFSLIVIYLAGVYFGSFLHILFIFFCVYPVLSFISLLIWNFSIDISESFSTTHPVKGEKLKYELSLRNRGFIPITNVRLVFETVSPAMELLFPDLHMYLPIGQKQYRSFSVSCPYRGEYKVGLSRYELHDPLRLFKIARKAQPRTFTVYPRVLQLESFAPVATEIEGAGRYTSAGILPDTTMFHQLREYRDGDSLRHIYWKKYASTGKPYLKEYEKTKKSGVRIYFDLRKVDSSQINSLEQEDVSVETLVALVKYFLDRRIHTTVIGPGDLPFVFSASDSTSFNGFYLSTPQLRFHRAPTPTAIYNADERVGHLESQTVIFITHQLDPHIFSIESKSPDSSPIIVLNTASYPGNMNDEIESFVQSARHKTTEVVVVSSSDSICDELGESIYAGVT